MMAEKLITAPLVEPVTLTEAKAQAIVETTAYDTLITSKIKAARQWVENYLGRALVQQTWHTQLDQFPGGTIYLSRPPLQSVTEITYIDTSGVEQTLAAAAYFVDTLSTPGRVVEAYGYTWPDTLPRAGAVTIESVHGYDGTGDSPLDLSEIPQAIKEAILILCCDLYQHRERQIFGPSSVYVSDAVESLLFPYRVQPFLS
jgi:uncharacterized phiE125 gp8 family phage protein